MISSFRNCTLLALGTLSAGLLAPSPAIAADGWWIDQYAVLLFTAAGRLDTELAEMKRDGAETLLVHADSLPPLLLRWVAWRAERKQLKPVAWIQRPTMARLRHGSALMGYHALQVDDHFFADPLLGLGELRQMIGQKELWCSFQPNQFSESLAQQCDHIDVQIYRRGCLETVNQAYNLGLAGRPRSALAVYHSGTSQDTKTLDCFRQEMQAAGNSLFVFKWKNPEVWTDRFSDHPLIVELAQRYIRRFEK